MNGIDDYCGSDVVAESEGALLDEALITRAGRGCELAGRERPGGPMDADGGKWREKRGDEQVSGP